MNNARKVLILTGPGGAGKTTVAGLLESEYDYINIDGDQIDSEFFPEGNQWQSENINLLRKAHDKIIEVAKDKYYNTDKNIVLDYIIFGDYINFLNKFKKEFGDNLFIKVLYPVEEEMIKRDKERECWTTGEERIKAVREEFENIKEYIGQKNFIDSSKLSPEETIKLLK